MFSSFKRTKHYVHNWKQIQIHNSSTRHEKDLPMYLICSECRVGLCVCVWGRGGYWLHPAQYCVQKRVTALSTAIKKYNLYFSTKPIFHGKQMISSHKSLQYKSTCPRHSPQIITIYLTIHVTITGEDRWEALPPTPPEKHYIHKSWNSRAPSGLIPLFVAITVHLCSLFLFLIAYFLKLYNNIFNLLDLRACIQ